MPEMKTLTVNGVTYDVRDASNELMNHVPTTETADDTRFLRNDNTWQTITPENIGAAAAGYGYGGETMPEISGDESALDEMLLSMKVQSAKQFCFSGGDTTFNGLGYFHGTMYKTDNSYATAVAYNYYNNSTVRRTKSNGTWQPWEWVNPRMTLGVEYRTTERWEGIPVYTMFYSGGASATSLTISAPTGATRLVRYKIWHGPRLLPIGDFNKTSYYANSYLSNTSIIYLADDMSDGYGNGNTYLRVQVWYTKE